MGYKQTEVGVIPKYWDTPQLKSISSMYGRIGWQGLKQSEFTMDPDDPFLITGVNFKEGEIRWDEVYHIPLKRYEVAKDIQLKNDDVLMTKDGTIGKVLYINKIPAPNKASLNSHLLVFRPLLGKYVPKYLYYQLNSQTFKNHIEQEKSGSTFFGITQEAVSKYNIPLPPTRTEQTAIAQVLSDVDALISSLEKFTAKKRNIKQGVMQELLTGKKRLPGFTREWETKRLGEVADIIKGRGLSKGKLDPSGSNQCILYGELFTTYKQVIEHVVSRTNSIEGRLSKYGDVLMPGSTTTVGIDLAIASALLEDNVLLGGDIIILRKKDNSYNSEFLAHYLTQIKRHAIAELAQGITIIHMYGSNLINLELKLPSIIEEQDAIATILSDMEAEIETLEQKLSKYRLIKQGMMQELLTGKKRMI